jgi:hypothetical protein
MDYLQHFTTNRYLSSILLKAITGDEKYAAIKVNYFNQSMI